MPSTEASASPTNGPAVPTATGRYVFKMDGYRKKKDMHGNGQCIDSGRFVAAGHAWRIRCYPNGDTKDSAGFISLYLKLADVGGDGATAAATTADNNEEIHTEVRFSLVPHAHYDEAVPALPVSRSFTAIFYTGTSWGFTKFISKHIMERFLEDDCCAIQCDMAGMDKLVMGKERDLDALEMETPEMLHNCSEQCLFHIQGRGTMKATFILREWFLKFFIGCFKA